MAGHLCCHWCTDRTAPRSLWPALNLQTRTVKLRTCLRSHGHRGQRGHRWAGVWVSPRSVSGLPTPPPSAHSIYSLTPFLQPSCRSQSWAFAPALPTAPCSSGTLIPSNPSALALGSAPMLPPGRGSPDGRTPTPFPSVFLSTHHHLKSSCSCLGPLPLKWVAAMGTTLVFTAVVQNLAQGLAPSRCLVNMHRKHE